MTAVGDLSVSVLAAGPSVSAQVFGSMLIGLREGLEASIVVMILVAFLVKSDRRDALKWVWLGVGAALAMTIGVFVVIQFGETTITGLAAEAIAGVASLCRSAVSARPASSPRHRTGSISPPSTSQPTNGPNWWAS